MIKVKTKAAVLYEMKKQLPYSESKPVVIEEVELTYLGPVRQPKGLYSLGGMIYNQATI